MTKEACTVWVGCLVAFTACSTPRPEPIRGPASPTAPGRAGPVSVARLAETSTSAGDRSADRCDRTAHPFLQPVAVVEDWGLRRYPPVLGFPMAFPRGAGLRSLTGFTATTVDGRPLPTQLEILSRWGDGPDACQAPIRWAYAWVLGEVPPNERAYLALRHVPDETPSLSPTLGIEETARAVIIDTGPARFTISKRRFNGIQRVELRSPEGWLRVAEIRDPRTEGMLVWKGRTFASAANGRRLSFEIERAGPHVATLAAKGTYATKKKKDVFRYTVRLHFYAGTAAVAFDHTYYNGRTESFRAGGATNRMQTDRVFFRLPVSVGNDLQVSVRLRDKLHTLRPTAEVSLAQDKRSPERPQVVSFIRHGEADVELGTYADRPLMAVRGDRAYALATIGLLGPRDPQALRFEPRRPALELDWQSEALYVGGARGIWSKAVLDFGTGAVDLGMRGTQLYAHAARPLIGVPSTRYLNSTGAHGLLPTSEMSGPYTKVEDDLDELHRRTTTYLRRQNITGTQIWPDLPRKSCSLDHGCDDRYFEGGDNNYWDWSHAELDQFFRTADPALIHDFALGEAITMAETISFRPDWWTKSGRSSFAGLSPCYGTSRGYEGPWREGLNHRRDNCPGDYSYNKVHALAYILTADRRFTDFFVDGANTAIRMYFEHPKVKATPWLELVASRTFTMYVEPLLTAAEFSRRGTPTNRRYRDIGLRYFDFMRKHMLQRGHTCDKLGTGVSDPALLDECAGMQGFMLPIFIDWVARLATLFDHQPARDWLADFVPLNTGLLTETDDQGLPDPSTIDAWYSLYYCATGPQGVRDDTCKVYTEWENEGRFYSNGLVAYLSTFALVHQADLKDPLRICQWLPEAYAAAVQRLDATQLNDYVWGKAPGQAYAYGPRVLGTIERCLGK